VKRQTKHYLVTNNEINNQASRLLTYTDRLSAAAECNFTYMVLCCMLNSSVRVFYFNSACMHCCYFGIVCYMNYIIVRRILINSILYIYFKLVMCCDWIKSHLV